MDNMFKIVYLIINDNDIKKEFIDKIENDINNEYKYIFESP